MPDSSITPAQQAFITALEGKVASMLSSQLDGEFKSMSVPNGLYRGIQFGPNNYYNEKFLDQINLQAITNNNGMMSLGNTEFTSLYNGILQSITFEFSDADKDALQKDRDAYAAQIQAVIKTWESDYAPITNADLKDAVPPTKLGYIQEQVVKHWGSVENIPSSMQEFKDAYSSFQISAQSANRLTMQSATAMNRLKAAIANIKAPSAGNGGLEVAAGKYALPFGPFPTQNYVNNHYQSDSSSVTINMKLDNFSSKSSHLSIDASVGFSIPILDFLSIGFKGSTHYSLDKYASSETVITMSTKYNGITVIGAPLTDSALSTNNKSGWYANDILSQAIANKDGQKTGYSLRGDMYPVDEYFGEGKKFSRIKTWVVSREPTITMQFCGADTDSVVSDFKEQSTVSIKLFDLFTIGSVSQSYEVQTVDTHSVAGCVTVVLAPPKSQSGTTLSGDSTAYVIGGVPSYPPDHS